MSFIPLTLSTHKKNVIYRFYMLLFVFFFLNLKNRNGLLNNFFFFNILKIVLKSDS